MTKRLLVVNGSIRGGEGNTAELLEVACKALPAGAWRSWPVVRAQQLTGRYPATGPLDLGAPRFLGKLAGWPGR